MKESPTLAPESQENNFEVKHTERIHKGEATFQKASYHDSVEEKR